VGGNAKNASLARDAGRSSSFLKKILQQELILRCRTTTSLTISPSVTNVESMSIRRAFATFAIRKMKELLKKKERKEETGEIPE